MKYVYILLGFLSLGLGIIGIFLPILPTTPFLLLTLFFFAKGSKRLEAWFLRTSVYQKHLKSFNERRAMTKKTKISILFFSTTMLLSGFYFTPSVVGRSIIAVLIAVKYWFFLFWIKTEEIENEPIRENEAENE
ncbi:YbaN family protein [Rodentibacter haemolyticus]|uniref:Inner membrane protein n=1 Tax=Rodentibacter haemolyticus TaxID=2778911 RepID=A0ABX6UZE1_9PAST|nr:YbaN family protein [Rodentibacter haemolyticus]QPB43222.1 YbaN family protein [Rodentibacter haemolyticus]